MFSLPILPILVSWILAFALGAVWYSPLLFSKPWVAAMQVRDPQWEPKPKPMHFILSALMWLLGAVMFATLVQMTGYDGNLLSLICIAVVVFLGFALSPMIMALVFEDQHPTVILVGAGYHLGAYILMALTHWLM